MSYFLGHVVNFDKVDAKHGSLVGSMSALNVSGSKIPPLHLTNFFIKASIVGTVGRVYWLAFWTLQAPGTFFH